MPPRSGKPLFPNPFYVLLLLASTLFVLTALGYLVAPAVIDASGRQPDTAGRRLARWLDRNGPIGLGVEVVVMVAAGFLAMGTDRWFPEKPPRPTGRGG